MASRVAARAPRRGRRHAGGLGFGGVVDHRRVRAVAGDRSAHGAGRHDRVRRLPTPHSSVVGGETPGRVLRQRSRVGRAERAALLASAVSRAAPRPRDATRPPRARYEERARCEAGAPSIAARNGAVGQRCDEDGRGSRRLMPGPNVPFPPMEAQLVEKLPEGERWQYEPKWDGFRGVLENDGGELALWSRNERPLLRYFPELRKLGDLLPPHSALDGEIVIELIGLDGVIAKRVDLPYKPGARDAVSKVKHHRTVDCVIVGYRTSGTKIASLLLGLYREDGTLDFVGHTSGIAGPLQAQLQEMLPPLLKEDQHIDQDWGRTPEGGSRWSQGKDLPWHEIRPEIVCEVRFDKMEQERFRHGTRFIRFRPDKEPKQCTWEQVKPTAKPGDPRLDDLLRGKLG